MTIKSLLIAGAQKSSSTSLADLLGRHPLVSMAEREVVAFEDPYYPIRLRREILAHLEASAATGCVPALKRPELLYRPESLDRVRRHLPDPVIVVVLREPLARTVSAYHHYVRHGLLPAVDANLGINSLLDEFAQARSGSARHQVIAYSLYSASLRRLRKEFGNRVVVFFQEELHSDTLSCTSQIFRCLGIETIDLGPLPRSNAGDYSIRRLRPSRLGGRIGYKVDEEGHFYVTTRPVQRLAGQALFALDRLSMPPGGSPPQLNAGVRCRLVGLLASDAQRLPGMLGRPLPEEWLTSLES